MAVAGRPVALAGLSGLSGPGTGDLYPTTEQMT